MYLFMYDMTILVDVFPYHQQILGFKGSPFKSITFLWSFGKNLRGKLIPKSFFPHPRFVILTLIQYFDPNKHLMLNVGK